jgi:hypothetical protein
MAEFLVQYRIDNQIKTVTLSASDEIHAGHLFGEQYPDVSPNSVVAVHSFGEPGDSLIIFLKTLWSGNFGLPMTYWVYGVLGGIVWAVGILALSPEPDSSLDQIVRFLLIAYGAVVYVGIWQAANKYTGNKAWAVLAKFMVIVVALPIAIRLLKFLASSV